MREQFLRNETVDWSDWLLETLPIEAGSKFFNFCVFTSVELPQIHADTESFIMIQIEQRLRCDRKRRDLKRVSANQEHWRTRCGETVFT